VTNVVEALCRAIEQHEAFRKEVSDVAESVLESFGPTYSELDDLARFVIPTQVDPLLDAIRCEFDVMADELDASNFREALAKRGGRIVFEGEG